MHVHVRIRNPMTAEATARPSPADSPAQYGSFAAGVVTALVGATVLCGWIWRIDALKSVNGGITMKTNAAIAILLCGVALTMHRSAPRFARACALAAAAIGALTLSEHLFGWDLGIDQLLFPEAPGAPATASPNRMGPNGATSLVLAGSALTLLASRSRRVNAIHLLSFAAIVLALLPFVGYMYGARDHSGVAKYTGIALHTTITFFILNVGILVARADEGFIAVFSDAGPAGTMLRRLAIPVVVIPPALGYLFIRGRAALLFDRETGIAIYSVALIVVLMIIVCDTVRAVNRIETERRAVERDRDQLIVSERNARAEAERASRLKDQFIATLSHELRTPLNVMLGWTSVLEAGTRPDEHARIAGLVARNGRLLARLVEDLLDISRVSSGQFDLARAPVSLNAVAQSVVESIAPAAAAKQVTVALDADPHLQPVDADPHRLQQIVSNLLSNAVKFTNAGGRIGVRTARRGQAAELTVTDTGIGFDQSFAPELFKPFRQADPSTSREHGGLGLGLSIARHLAELHGGTLLGSSEGAGRGATFTLALPCSVGVGTEEAEAAFRT